MFRSIRIAVVLSIAAFSIGVSRAETPPPPTQGQVSQSEHEAFVQALKPTRPGKPLIAVLASNEGTEMTDLLLPHAVLSRAGVGDVKVVAPRAGPISLYPALRVQAEQDLAGFDRFHPTGADYVIVPAMQTDNDPVVIRWLQQQARKGAQIIAVCSGARVVGQAGLLDGRRFTGHWYDRITLLERHPSATYIPNQRYLVDRGVATTTGISASVPAMLALVEAIAGNEKARDLADELGVASWGPEHDSAAFGLDVKRRAAYLFNRAAFWLDQRWRVDVRNGIDDIGLALAADAWSRTGRVKLQAVSSSGPVAMQSGLVLLAQPPTGDLPRMPLSPATKPVRQLDQALCEIGRRYGPSRRDWVMQEMEYPGPTASGGDWQCPE